MAASLKEIAKASGVSVATAARFLNGEQKEVWASTARRAQRVRDIAKQMGYRPNHRAKSLARKRSMAIGMLYGREGIFQADNYHRVIANISEQLAHNGYDLMMIPGVGDASAWSSKLMDGRVDGCIVCDPAPDDLQKVIENIDLPMIGINLSTDADIPNIQYNEVQGAQLVMEHLLELGHQRYWLVAYDHASYKSLEHVSFIARHDTIKTMLKQRGLDDNFQFHSTPPQQTIALLASLPVDQRPTAIIAQNDAKAMQVIQQLDIQGIKVPTDISVVGFNDDNASQFYVPALTSISLPLHQATTRAVDYLLDRLQNPDTPVDAAQLDAALDERLVIRQSSAMIKQ
ncbi:MAG: LacI family DNA-binding transcriptional regulator [Phycisphaeraceae bacterium JB051]